MTDENTDGMKFLAEVVLRARKEAQFLSRTSGKPSNLSKLTRDFKASIRRQLREIGVSQARAIAAADEVVAALGGADAA